MKNSVSFIKRLGVYILALSIPGLLVVTIFQTRHYENIEKEVEALEQKQNDLIESNKAYVTDISLLSSSSRIEKIATEKLGMQKAQTKDIIRVSIKGE